MDTNHKQLVGEKACEYVKDGMILGLGTGSTVYYTICKIGQMVKEGLKVQAVPTSIPTEKLAREMGIPLMDMAEVISIDLGIDGADEFDKNKQLVKGGGGALLREKIIASLCKDYICVADHSKSSEYLNSFALPVEITPFAKEITARKLESFGCQVSLRMADGEIYETDNKNYILDCKFDKILDPHSLAQQINMIPGVVENGLFVDIAKRIICTDANGKVLVID